MYRIIRFYQDRDVAKRIIVRGLTLVEAQAHCRDPEHASAHAQDRGHGCFEGRHHEREMREPGPVHGPRRIARDGSRLGKVEQLEHPAIAFQVRGRQHPVCQLE